MLRLFGLSFGDLAAASFVLCAVSGVFLVAPFDVRDPARSIAEWSLANSGAVFVRNVHYWTAQLFLICTVLHGWDHFRAATERRMPRGVWLRLMLAMPVMGLLLLSGFLLRGDGDAKQALRIVRELMDLVPSAGAWASTFFFGVGEQLHVVYAHHVATTTLIVWLAIVEHARRLWPRADAMAAMGVATAAAAVIVSPGLHDGMDPVLKGPWYFLGLQELLHWTSWPLTVVCGCLGAAVLVWAVPHCEGRLRTALLWCCAVALGGYAALCGIGLFMRGENWNWQPGWPSGSGDLQAGFIFAAENGAVLEGPKNAANEARREMGRAAPTSGSAIPIVLGRPEGCLVCHSGISGLGDAHRPEAIGCASCHGGNVFTLEKLRAHAGLIRVPGNLADAPRTCGQAACHPTIPGRVERSIMSTFAGAIAVNRTVFGEPVSKEAPPPSVGMLGNSPADSHFRQLCASCHLGQTKEAWGPLGEEARGGGCNACHLVYSEKARAELAAYEATPLKERQRIPLVHPDLNAKADDRHCFGCHSRSSRISTNYEGWHELNSAPPEEQRAQNRHKGGLRLLDDGRWFKRVLPDVHSERGLACVDCHTAQEVMGTGHVVRDKAEQVRVRCEDCHADTLARVTPAAADPESRKLLALRGTRLSAGEALGRTRAGEALVNVVVTEDGKGRLVGKVTGRASELRAPARACSGDRAHARLACASCHTAWAPRCASCHTSYDPRAEGYDHLTQRETRGAWQEQAGPFEAVPPTLGVRKDPRDPARPEGTIDTFVPGMILRLDRNRTEGAKPDRSFHRLYARMAAHTIRKEVRSCESCHADPVALGFGRGQLRFTVEAGRGIWRFEPELAKAAEDGLPEDAWVGFGQTRLVDVSTRADARPFTREEQRRILRVGACLTCHEAGSLVMRRALGDFEATWRARGAACADVELR